MYSYTQEYVASALGIVRQTYSYYETGKRKPTPEILYKLAGLYNISVADLLELTVDIDRNVYYDAPEPTSSSEELSDIIEYFNDDKQKKRYQNFSILEKELLYYFNKISEEDKKEIIEIIKIKYRKNKK